MISSPPFPIEGLGVAYKQVVEEILQLAEAETTGFCERNGIPWNGGQFPPGEKINPRKILLMAWPVIPESVKTEFLVKQYAQAVHYLNECVAAFAAAGVKTPEFVTRYGGAKHR